MIITKVESNADYHANKRYLSSSGVKTIVARSVYHLLHSQPYTETEDMMLGTATHARALEPKSFASTYVVAPEYNGSTKAGKAIKAEFEEKQKEGKIILRSHHSEMIEGMQSSLEANPLAMSYLEGQVELSHYTEFMGVKVKVRPDVIAPDFINDLKTCRDASPRAFRREIYSRNYHVQAAFYCTVLGYTMDKFKFTAMQKTYPYDVIVYTLSEQMQEEGYNLMVDAVGKWKHYLDTGEALGYEWEKASDGSLIL